MAVENFGTNVIDSLFRNALMLPPSLTRMRKICVRDLNKAIVSRWYVLYPYTLL